MEKILLIIAFCLLPLFCYGQKEYDYVCPKEIVINNCYPLYNKYDIDGYVPNVVSGGHVLKVFSVDKKTLTASVYDSLRCGNIEVDKDLVKLLKKNGVKDFRKDNPEEFENKVNSIHSSIDRNLLDLHNRLVREKQIKDSIDMRNKFVADSLAQIKAREDSIRNAKLSQDSLAYCLDTLDFPTSYSFLTKSILKCYKGTDDEYSYSSIKYIPEDVAVFPRRKIGKWYECDVLGKLVYIKEDDMDDEEFRNYLVYPCAIYQKIRTLYTDQAAYKDAYDFTSSVIDFYDKHPLVIERSGCYDMSEYTDGTGYRITFYNGSKKTVKYVYLTVQAYNSVDDPVGRPLSRRCIGPIYSGDGASYDFEYLWFTDVVDYTKITSLKVQYMDNSVRAFKAANCRMSYTTKEIDDFMMSINDWSDINSK